MKKITYFLILCLLMIRPPAAAGGFYFNEIMYDPAGNDDGREWIEIYNDGTVLNSQDVILKEGGSLHKIHPVDGNNSIAIGRDNYAVIASDAAKFMIDYPHFSGLLFDSSFSLKNTGEILELLVSGTSTDSVDYSAWLVSQSSSPVAGLSLNKVDSIWKFLSATPGQINNGTSSPGQIQSATTTESNLSSVNSPVLNNTPNDVPNVNQILSPVSIISCKIIGLNQVIVGEQFILKGVATGLSGRPLADVRFLWTFGDGTTAEGQTVSHIFHFEGDYMITLSVSSNKYNAEDRLVVHTIKPKIGLEVSVPGNDLIISIASRESVPIDISGFFIVIGREFPFGSGTDAFKRFELPPETFIAPSSFITLNSQDRFKNWIDLARQKEPLSLYYPNGKVITTFDWQNQQLKMQTAESSLSSTSAKINSLLKNKPKPKTISAKVAGKKMANVEKNKAKAGTLPDRFSLSAKSMATTSDIILNATVSSSNPTRALLISIAILLALILLGLAGLRYFKADLFYKLLGKD